MCDWAFRWLPGSGGFNPFPDFAAKCALSQDAASSANAARVVSLLGDRYLGSGIMESDLPGCVAQVRCRNSMQCIMRSGARP
eukprot:SAG31_NODE_68_length_28153_cov_23.647717_12_plen_82_part_00